MLEHFSIFELDYDFENVSNTAEFQIPNETQFFGGDNALPEPRIDAQGRAYATGKRKDAIARVWVKPGTGRVTVNGRDIEVFFARPTQRMIINQPFVAAGRVDQYDVVCTVKGGGLSGQAGALRHGISWALTRMRLPALRTLPSSTY